MLVNKDIIIGKYLSGNATAEESKKLLDWLKQDAAHQAEFDRMKRFWNASLQLKKDKDADVNAAWDQFRQLTETQPEISIHKPRYSWSGMAAGVAIFAVSALFVKLFMEGAPAKRSNIASYQAPAQAEELISVNTPGMGPVVVDSLNYVEEEPVKNQAKAKKKFTLQSNTAVAMITVVAGDSAKIFMLPDNSVVYLNTKSRLEYPNNFNKSNRHVTLIGEAYFDVKKDSAQFVVSCEHTVIKGRATQFNVKSHSSDKEVEVIVASGSVEFSGVGYKDFKKLTLKSGESGYYNKAKSEIVKSKHQRKNYKWWERKSLRAMIKAFFDKLMGKKSKSS